MQYINHFSYQIGIYLRTKTSRLKSQGDISKKDKI